MRLAHVGVDSFKFCVVWSWTLQTLRVMNLRARDTGKWLLLKGENSIWPALKMMPLLADFAKRVRKATVSLFVPVRPSAWNNPPSQQWDFRENWHWRLSLKFVYTQHFYYYYYYYYYLPFRVMNLPVPVAARSKA